MTFTEHDSKRESGETSLEFYCERQRLTLSPSVLKVKHLKGTAANKKNLENGFVTVVPLLPYGS